MKDDLLEPLLKQIIRNKRKPCDVVTCLIDAATDPQDKAPCIFLSFMMIHDVDIARTVCVEGVCIIVGHVSRHRYRHYSTGSYSYYR